MANKILSGGLAEEIKHGPLATAVSLITAPGTSVANRTGRAQLYTKLAGFSKNDLIKRITDLLILRSQ